MLLSVVFWREGRALGSVLSCSLISIAVDVVNSFLSLCRFLVLFKYGLFPTGFIHLNFSYRHMPIRKLLNLYSWPCVNISLKRGLFPEPSVQLDGGYYYSLPLLSWIPQTIPDWRNHIPDLIKCVSVLKNIFYSDRCADFWFYPALIIFMIYPALIIFMIYPALIIFMIYPALIIFMIYPALIIFMIYPALIIFMIYPDLIRS